MHTLHNFIQNDAQQKVIEQLHLLKTTIEKNGQQADAENKLPLDSIQALLDMGYNKLTLPQQYGGDGFGIYDAILFQETLASFDGPTALAIGWQLFITGDIFSSGLWSEQQLQQFAEAVVQERALINRIASEAVTGSPTRGGKPATTATFNDGHWHITGRKSYATLSYALTHFLTSAWIEEKQALGFFLIPHDVQGVSIEDTWDMASMRGTASHDLILQDVVLPLDALVELSDQPRASQINGWGLLIPAVYLGIAQAARNYAVEFAANYKPNSLPHVIGELPHIQDKIGQIELKLLTARHFIYSVAEKFEQPTHNETIDLELGAAKHLVVNSAIEIIDLAMRIVGAQSLQSQNPLSRYYRDVRAGLHNPPMDDMTILKLAKAALLTAKEPIQQL